MSNSTSPTKSPPQSNSGRPAISRHRGSERWWRWEPESPNQSPILSQKRNRNKSRIFPEPELYSGEAETDARKRMRLLGSYPDSRINKSQTVSDLESKSRVSSTSLHENPRASNEMSEDATMSKKGTCSPFVLISTRNKTSLEGDRHNVEQVQRLKREIYLLGIHHTKKTSTLEQDVKYLQEENFALCRKLHWYKTQYEAKEKGSFALDEIEELSAELERRNIEIEEKIQQNSSLEEQLNTAEGLSAVLKDSQAGNNVSIRFSEDLTRLGTAISQAALLLFQCLSEKQLSKLRKNPRKNPELDALIKSSLGKISVLSSDSKLAFSALIFGFIRERVFYSNCWTALQLEGYMLRGYQAAIRRITPLGTLEGFHRAALELMLEENHPFRDCWVQSHVEEAQHELLGLLSSLLETSKLESFDKDIQNALNRVFTNAFHFRARCVPPRGTRYELMQATSGDIFDPEHMEAQRPDGSNVSVPCGETHRIKVCVLGSLVSHVFEEEPLNGDTFNTISQPFVSAKQRYEVSGSIRRGTLRSGKAIVILEERQP